MRICFCVAVTALTAACFVGCQRPIALDQPSAETPTLKWRLEATLPDTNGVAGPYAGLSNNALVVAGGANFPNDYPWEGGEKVWQSSIYVLPYPTSEWITGPWRLHRPMAYGVSVTAPAGLVCVGGGDGEKHYTDVFLLQWKQGRVIRHDMPALPVPMAFGCGTLVGKTIYVYGGLNSPDAARPMNSLWAFDLDKFGDERKWRELPACPGGPRMLAVAGSLDGAFYVFGGVDLGMGDATITPVQPTKPAPADVAPASEHDTPATPAPSDEAGQTKPEAATDPQPAPFPFRLPDAQPAPDGADDEGDGEAAPEPAGDASKDSDAEEAPTPAATETADSGDSDIIRPVTDAVSEPAVARRYLRDCWRYTPQDGWEQLPDLPYTLAGAPSPAFTYQGLLYIPGGDDGSYAGDQLGESHPGFRRALLVFDPQKERWGMARQMLPLNRRKNVWPPVTVPAVTWGNSLLIPSGEVRPGIRSPQLLWAFEPEPKTAPKDYYWYD